MNVQVAQQFYELLLALGAFLCALTFHEFSHALAAFSLGDETAKMAGRLSLNPTKHIDPLGLLFLLLFRIGWAKPVPMNPKNFKRPRIDAVLAGLAGPFANFVLALAFLYIIRYTPFDALGTRGAWALRKFATFSIDLNVMLGVFNLLPIPPLDGSHLIYALIPTSWRQAYMRFLPYSVLILVLLLFTPSFLNKLLQAFSIAKELLTKLVL